MVQQSMHLISSTKCTVDLGLDNLSRKIKNISITGFPYLGDVILGIKKALASLSEKKTIVDRRGRREKVTIVCSLLRWKKQSVIEKFGLIRLAASSDKKRFGHSLLIFCLENSVKC